MTRPEKRPRLEETSTQAGPSMDSPPWSTAMPAQYVAAEQVVSRPQNTYAAQDMHVAAAVASAHATHNAWQPQQGHLPALIQYSTPSMCDLMNAVRHLDESAVRQLLFHATISHSGTREAVISRWNWTNFLANGNPTGSGSGSDHRLPLPYPPMQPSDTGPFLPQPPQNEAYAHARAHAYYAHVQAQAELQARVQTQAQAYAQAQPQAQGTVTGQVHPFPRKDIDFNHLVDEVDYIISDKYRSSKGSKEFQQAFEATSDIEACIAKISSVDSTELTSESQRSAVESLHNIADLILAEHGSTIGSEVRKHFHMDDSIAQAMISIINWMKPADRYALVQAEAGEETFLDSIKNLSAIAEDYAADMGFDEVLERLQGIEQKGL